MERCHRGRGRKTSYGKGWHISNCVTLPCKEKDSRALHPSGNGSHLNGKGEPHPKHNGRGKTLSTQKAQGDLKENEDCYHRLVKHLDGSQKWHNGNGETPGHHHALAKLLKYRRSKSLGQP